jgi:hypothetical protein
MGDVTLTTSPEIGEWLSDILKRISPKDPEMLLLEELKRDYEKRFSTPFDSFLRSHEWKTLRGKGLLLI